MKRQVHCVFLFWSHRFLSAIRQLPRSFSHINHKEGFSTASTHRNRLQNPSVFVTTSTKHVTLLQVWRTVRFDDKWLLSINNNGRHLRCRNTCKQVWSIDLCVLVQSGNYIRCHSWYSHVLSQVQDRRGRERTGEWKKEMMKGKN
jgi:hypothetical protein